MTATERPSRGHGTWVAGGLATALILLWLAGDATAVRRIRSDPEAMRLLRGAVGADRTTPYQGTWFVASWNQQGASTSLVKVEHTPGDGTRMTPQRSGGAAWATFRPDTAATGAGIAGFTPRMLDQLTRNFSVVRAAVESICGRSARVVEARRRDGGAAGRFWIDRETGLMLHRELLDPAGRRVSATGFYDLRIEPPPPEVTPNARLGLGGDRSAARPQGTLTPWGQRLGEEDLRTLREDGWAVPGRLPGGLVLQEVRRSAAGSGGDGSDGSDGLDGSGQSTAAAASDEDARAARDRAEAAPAGGVLHLNYSDGLSVVSVFVQRGRLDERSFDRWRRTTVKGRTVFRYEALQRWSVWTSRGYVYSVLADAPRSTADTVVGALPHGDGGFRARMGRGFARLGSWMNPFG